MTTLRFSLLLLILGSFTLPNTATAQWVSSEFIYVEAPFASCHASTLVETERGILAAWFGGTAEGRDDVEIWTSQLTDGNWSAPKRVADGVQEDGKRFPCWNPVLFQLEERLLLFYKVGPSPREWWGMVKESTDAGESWSEARRLPEGILGPIKNKPILLSNGRLLCGSSSEHGGWRLHMEWSDDQGKTWERTEALNPSDSMQSIQPTLLRLPNDRIQALCRAKNEGRITTTTTDDGGNTWSEVTTLALPNNNSGIDAVTLSDGRHVLIYNHLSRGRSKLHMAISKDAKNWEAVMILEDEPRSEFSYPAIIQTKDGKIHVTYTWKRERVKHVVVDPDDLETQPILGGEWPLNTPDF